MWSPTGPPKKVPEGDRRQENEQNRLGLRDAQPVFLDQKERIIALEGLDIDELAEQQRPENGEGDDEPSA